MVVEVVVVEATPVVVVVEVVVVVVEVWTCFDVALLPSFFINVIGVVLVQLQYIYVNNVFQFLQDTEILGMPYPFKP
ncbi:hypothetical protein ElyMa_001072000 [Elysia marginata]|uniref:Uncharacterized protein n=1 Tax=Elysia marginata TaxID=1093978 RepID=A0AAV4HS89_9GAST|nr:hypothetical protein ElyMa_001072000 [Elysia marginata]